MQVFLPSKDFHRSAKMLDNKRLGKQRVECGTLMISLLRISPRIKPPGKVYRTKNGWRNHPAGEMFRGYEGSLFRYWKAVSEEWTRRGYNNEGNQLNLDYVWGVAAPFLKKHNDDPPWLGKKKFHASHRSNLLRKDSKFYGQFGWSEPDDLPYHWPVKTVKTH